MAETIYARPNKRTKNGNTPGEKEERIVDIYASLDSLRDKNQDHVGTEESSVSPGTVGVRPKAVSPPRCPIMAVMVLLGLLAVVLLAGLLGLALQYKTVMESMERDMEQVLPRMKTLTEKMDALLCHQGCPNGWDKFGCKCYWLSDKHDSWNKSREFCVSLGADLVAVDSEEKISFIEKYRSYFWLGATDEASEGVWRWVDGTLLSVGDPSWRTGEPNGGEDQNCLKVANWMQSQYKWADESCEGSNKWLCEMNLVK